MTATKRKTREKQKDTTKYTRRSDNGFAFIIDIDYHHHLSVEEF